MIDYLIYEQFLLIVGEMILLIYQYLFVYFLRESVWKEFDKIYLYLYVIV